MGNGIGAALRCQGQDMGTRGGGEGVNGGNRGRPGSYFKVRREA